MIASIRYFLSFTLKNPKSEKWAPQIYICPSRIVLLQWSCLLNLAFLQPTWVLCWTRKLATVCSSDFSRKHSFLCLDSKGLYFRLIHFLMFISQLQEVPIHCRDDRVERDREVVHVPWVQCEILQVRLRFFSISFSRHLLDYENRKFPSDKMQIKWIIFLLKMKINE